MKCSNCDKELSEESKFCSYCGTPVQIAQEGQSLNSTDGEKAKSQSKPELSQTQRDKTTGGFLPVTLIGIVFSSIAFLTGIVLYSIILSRKVMAIGHDTLVLVPAFVGLAFGIFALRNGIVNRKNSEKLFGCIAILLSGFAVFYGFVAYCVLLG